MSVLGMGSVGQEVGKDTSLQGMWLHSQEGRASARNPHTPHSHSQQDSPTGTKMKGNMLNCL